MENKIRVLFVDDEPNILAALRRMLRIKHNDWDMHFVESGPEALAEMEQKVYDVIVSDIRMPGMDGAELLTRVKDEYPGVIRVALSGQVDLNEVIRSIRAVHQYISKPCEAEDLIDKIEGALRSRDVLTDTKMLHLVTEIDTLPVLPRVFRDIENELAKEEPSIQAVADLITQDVGFVAKIMKLVNSPFFGLPTNINSLHQAITMLGLETVKALVLSTHLFDTYDDKKLKGFKLSLLWEHCFRVSNIARLIARCEGVNKEIETQCRMAGLLHDVGKLILANYFPDKYAEVVAIATEQGGPICDIEKEIFGTTHAEVGAYLMGLWGVPGEVVHGIGYHHEYNKLDMSVAMFLSVANVIDHNFVVFNDEYSKIKLNTGMSGLIQNDKLMLKWLRYLEDNWLGVESYYSVDEQAVSALLA